MHEADSCESPWVGSDFGLLSKQNRTSRFIYTVSAFILMLRVDGTRSNLAS